VTKSVVIGGGRVVTPDGVLDDGFVVVSGDRISEVGQRATAPVDVDLGGHWLLPGFIDLHVHGGGGHDVTRSAEAMARAVDYHRRRGTTRTLVSLMAQPVDALCEQLGWVAQLGRDGRTLGAHLEGPFLATNRCGAQNPANLLLPDAAVARKLVESAEGWVRTMTLAPELPHVLPLIGELVDAGVIAAIGHTDATYDQARDGIAAGATLATHLFNAMGSFSQREPGPSIAALDAGIAVELINDGVHVHHGLARLLASRFGEQVVCVTDAISATGVGDGDYTLGDQSVVVRDGRALLAGSDHLAGSTLTLDEALRRAVEVLGLSVEAASRLLSANPARVLGVDDAYGTIAEGRVADLVVLDAQLGVDSVMLAGSWL
jgi:N-acetylglucosamine-6-phosphate deacetylase